MWIGWYGTSDAIQRLVRLTDVQVKILAALPLDEGPCTPGELLGFLDLRRVEALLGLTEFVTFHRVELLSSLEGVE